MLITLFAPISGAHFNPTVTVAMRLRGEMRSSNAFANVVVQIVAAVTGLMLALRCSSCYW